MTITLPFPKQGIVRHFERSTQNSQTQGYYAQFQPESTWNAVNIIPYDRFDRLRGATRPGTAKLYNTWIDGGPVTQMAQTVTYKATAPVTIIADNFVPGGGGGWTAGQALEQHGSWTTYQTAAGNNFSFVGTSLIGAASVTPSDTNIVAAVGVQYLKRGAFDQDVAAIRSVPGGNADNYTIRYQAPAGAVNNRTLTAVVRYNAANPSVFVLVNLFFFNTGAIPEVIVQFTDGAGNPINQTAGAITWGNTSNSATVVVQGNTITVSADGVPDPGGTPSSSSCNTSIGAGQLGVGFDFNNTGNNAGSLPPSAISSVTVTSIPPPTQRQVNLIAVAATTPASTQDVFVGTLNSIAKATGGSGVVAANVIPQICYTAGQAYIVDGTGILQVDVPNAAMVAFTASAGVLPTNTTLCTVWRDRLVLANSPAFPQNFYMSRVGSPRDWNYAAVDPAAAFAGSASTAGHIGEPITALMPFNDDILLIGGDHNLWQVHGDPADGGSIDLVSDAIGVHGANAWTKDPQGNIWFFGTSGLYRIAPGGMPENMSSKTFNQPFTQIDWTQNYINLVWNSDLIGMHIFISPMNQSAPPGTHLWYDARNGGLWNWIYPPSHGPVSALSFIGNGGANRVTLLGGWDGAIRQTAPALLDDDGILISTLLSLGPIQAGGPTNDAVLDAMDVTLAENAAADTTANINVTWTIKGGKSAFEVTEGTPRRTVSGTFSYPGRQLTRRPRLRGGWFAIEMANGSFDQYWGLEQVALTFAPNGKQR